jgi:sialic acid synthase SpsE
MRGNGIKMPMGDEVKNRLNNRKSIVSVNNIKKGEILTESNLDIKRPGFGIAPKYKYMLIGKRAIKDIEEDTLLQWGDFE